MYTSCQDGSNNKQTMKIVNKLQFIFTFDYKVFHMIVSIDMLCDYQGVWPSKKRTDE